MTRDTKSLIPSLSPEDDLDLPPPSYDSALASQPDVGSSTSHVVEERNIPQHLLHLFSGPSNGEPPISGAYVPPEQIEKISWRQRGLDIESSDYKLSDPNVLYDFIRAQAMTPPVVKIRCKGQHTEISAIDQNVVVNGVQTPKKKGETYFVTDFNFTIDLTEIINHPSNNNHIYLRTVPSHVSALRGTHSPCYGASFAPDLNKSTHIANGYQALDSEIEYGPTDIGRKATSAEKEEQNAWNLYRSKKGIPGWIKMQDCPEFWDTRPGSKLPVTLNNNNDIENARLTIDDKPSLKDWCKVYCKDKGIFKEFWVEKGLYGWETHNLVTAIMSAINSTGYQSNYLSVNVELSPQNMVIRSDNIFSRGINYGFIYFLSWITLIWPMIWILKRVFPRFFGAPWNVALVNYALKCYPPLPSTFPTESISQAQDRLASLYKLHPELPENPILQYGPKGVHYLLGRKEGEWFREWEERIRMGVRMKFIGELQGRMNGDGDVGQGLDGY